MILWKENHEKVSSLTSTNEVNAAETVGIVKNFSKNSKLCKKGRNIMQVMDGKNIESVKPICQKKELMPTF